MKYRADPLGSFRRDLRKKSPAGYSSRRDALLHKQFDVSPVADHLATSNSPILHLHLCIVYHVSPFTENIFFRWQHLLPHPVYSL